MGSEMCIRDRSWIVLTPATGGGTDNRTATVVSVEEGDRAMSTSEEHSALRQAATEVLERFDLVLEDLVVRSRSGTTQVRLVVDLPEDRTGSADLDTVAEASSALSELIDADGSLIGSGPSVLEVTTPGVDRALTTARHFRLSLIHISEPTRPY